MSLQELPELNKDDYKPLYAQLNDALIFYIKNKNLKPGDPLFSESELMKHYEVSRMTVRIAFQRLSTEGYITKVRGKGTFVAAPKLSNHIQDAVSLEKGFAEQGIEITNTLLQASIDYPAQYYLEELGLQPGSQTFKVRRLKMTGDLPLAIEIRNFPLDVSSRFSTSELEEVPAVDLINRDPETKIHHVSYKLRSTLLSEREAEVLQVPEGTAALMQFATHYNRVRKPVLSGRLTFLAELVEIRFDFHRDGQNHKQIYLPSCSKQFPA